MLVHQPSTRTGPSWAQKVHQRQQAYLHGIPSAGRVGSAWHLKNWAETLQLLWSERVADTDLLVAFRPANLFGKTEEEGRYQDVPRQWCLRGAGGRRNSRNSWPHWRYLVSVYVLKRNGMLKDGHKHQTSCALATAFPFLSFPSSLPSEIQLDEPINGLAHCLLQQIGCSAQSWQERCFMERIRASPSITEHFQGRTCTRDG